MNQTPFGTRAGWNSKSVKTRNVASDAKRDAAERRPHVTGRDVAPPAVVEAGEHEDRQLDRDDDEDDLPVEVAVVVDRAPLVEAELPREHPREGDDRRRRPRSATARAG